MNIIRKTHIVNPKVLVDDFLVRYDDMVDGEWVIIIQFTSFREDNDTICKISLHTDDTGKGGTVALAVGRMPLVNTEETPNLVRIITEDMECMRSKYNYDVEKLDKMYKLFLQKHDMDPPSICYVNAFSHLREVGYL